MPTKSLPAAMAALAITLMSVPTARAADPQPWRFFGGDIGNSRAQLSPDANINIARQINPRTAGRLSLKWSATTEGDVSATPTVEAGGLYVPDFAGYLYKLNPATGARLWSVRLSTYVGAYAYSRSSPAIGDRGEIVIGNAAPNSGASPGARVLSLNKGNGALNWQTIIDPSPQATVPMSPVIYNGRVYAATTSREESEIQDNPSYKPSFRASVVALDEATGRILWRQYMVPAGYTGGAVWGSSPSVWPDQKLLFVSTGNNYSVPNSVSACFSAVGTDLAGQYRCMDPTNFVDSMVALDLETGRLRWARKFAGADTWNLACSRGPQSACPVPAGGDYDFGQSPGLAWLPNFVGVPDDRGGSSRSFLLGAGQKSGRYWAVNPLNGGLYWSTLVGQGGLYWGSAINTDDHNAVYVALSNTAHYGNTLVGEKGGLSVKWNAGSWAGLDLRTGKFHWQVPAPGADLANPAFGGAATGPVTFTNRVVFAGATSGLFVALDANTGHRLWSYNTGGSVIGGPAVFDETLFWGAGSKRSGPGTVRRVFAFSVR